MEMKKKFLVLGLMSGSSLDGLDLAACIFDVKMDATGVPRIAWKMLACETMPFSSEWAKQLQDAPHFSAKELLEIHQSFGKYLGEQCHIFIKKNKLKPDFISSHGHTVFHHPERGFTCQIGDGAAIAAMTKLPVVADFRTMDIALGGQGTPIAPAADKYLFPGYDFYLNIGGISNITTTLNQNLIAFDIAPANQALNFLAQQVGLAYDKDGLLAAKGKVNLELKAALDSLDYFTQAYPKSLDNQWIKQHYSSIFQQYNCSIPDKLCTACHQQAEQISQTVHELQKLEHKKQYSMLVTGGGAFNSFLMAKIKEKSGLEIVLPSPEIIGFKEAVLMGLMGVLRWLEIPNCFASVTGAERDSIGGGIYV